ncbi:MAG: CoA transferase, partial [Comamonadaceae bacterium]
MGPLNGLKIIEMASIGPIPMCGMLLSDLGADVIRVDRTAAADLGMKRDARFDLTSRGKRSIALDLKSPAGRDVVLDLVRTSDALIEGFRPGVMERLGLGPEHCQAVNASLVYGRLTGWGQDGPLASAAGHDMNFIALTGALHAIGPKEIAPVAPLNLLGDFAGGSLFMALGVVSALYERSRSGRGQTVDAAIVDGVSSLMASIHGHVAGGTWRQERGEHVIGGAAPWNTVYETKDGLYVSLCAIEDRFFALLLGLLEIDPASVPDRMDRANWPALQRRLADIFLSKSRVEWCEMLEGTDVCFAPVLSPAEARHHPHMKERAVFE